MNCVEIFGDYGALLYGNQPKWVLKTVEAQEKRKIKKSIIKAGMKWIPGTFKTIIHEPLDIGGPLSQITTVGIRVKAIKRKRDREQYQNLP